METISVFTGMEVHGQVDMVVLKTFPNGKKLCWFEMPDDEDSSWDALWIAEPDEHYGWYGMSDLAVRTNFNGFRDALRWGYFDE